MCRSGGGRKRDRERERERERDRESKFERNYSDVKNIDKGLDEIIIMSNFFALKGQHPSPTLLMNCFPLKAAWYAHNTIVWQMCSLYFKQDYAVVNSRKSGW